jgi:hypothetical protein
MGMMRQMRSILGAGLVILLAAIIGGAAGDSTDYYFPDKQGAWQDRIYTEDIFQYYGKELGITLQGAKLFRNKVQSVIDVIRVNPVFNPPMGFQAVSNSQWRCEKLKASAPRSAEFAVIFYYFVNTNGQPEWGGEANTSFKMSFNLANPLSGYEFLRAPNGFVIYGGPRETSRVGNTPVYDEDLIVLHKPDRSPWIPATCEQYLTAWLQTRAAEIAETVSAIAAYDTADPYKKFLADKPKRQKAMEETYRQLSRSNPQKAEELRAQWQKMEEGMEAGLKNNRIQPMPAENEKALELLRSKVAETRQLLDSMTPSRKASPAWFKPEDQRLGPGLVDPGTPESNVLMVLNPEMYDRSRPSSDIQLIAVKFEDFRGLSEEHIGRRRLMQFRDAADWSRIAEIIGINSGSGR